jgi:hypothetical protein
MTLEKEWMDDYGVKGLESFLDTGLNNPTMFKRTIQPKEACLFYVGVLLLGQRQRVARAGLVLKDKKCFYAFNLPGSALIPCGQIVLKK